MMKQNLFSWFLNAIASGESKYIKTKRSYTNIVIKTKIDFLSFFFPFLIKLNLFVYKYSNGHVLFLWQTIFVLLFLIMRNKIIKCYRKYQRIEHLTRKL